MDNPNDILTSYDDALYKHASKTTITILILGPDPKKNKKSAKLRKYIYEKCYNTKYHHPMYAERSDLYKAFKREIGKYGDLCTYELHLAYEVADAVIFIPDSAGSLVELGMFSFNNKICTKSLVLFNAQHKPDKKESFINLGPKQAYDLRKADTEYVNYTELDKIWGIVDIFLSKQRSLKFAERFFRR